MLCISHLPVKSNEKAVLKRYKYYKNEFVSDYVATNPAVDIAESFAEYVLLKTSPKATSMTNLKIIFFDRYPQLREVK